MTPEQPKDIESVRCRPDFDGLLYEGSDPSALILPHFGLQWEEIQRLASLSDKPLADLGAGCSSLSVEAKLYGLDMIPVDLMENIRGGSERFKRIVKGTIDAYGDSLGLPENYRTNLRAALDAVAESYNFCDIAKMPFENRSFSVTLAHDSVPKHSVSLDRFLNEQLPEMLRVTDSHLYVYPFACYETSNEGELEPTAEHYQDENAIEKTRQLAWKHGFSFELLDSGERIIGSSPNQTALFVRFEPAKLESENFPERA